MNKHIRAARMNVRCVWHTWQFKYQHKNIQCIQHTQLHQMINRHNLFYEEKKKVKNTDEKKSSTCDATYSMRARMG